MIDLLRTIVNGITSIFNLTVHTLQSLIYFLLKIPTYISFFIDSLDLLPAVIVPFAIASIYIYVMYFILSRE